MLNHRTLGVSVDEKISNKTTTASPPGRLAPPMEMGAHVSGDWDPRTRRSRQPGKAPQPAAMMTAVAEENRTAGTSRPLRGLVAPPNPRTRRRASGTRGQTAAYPCHAAGRPSRRPARVRAKGWTPAQVWPRRLRATRRLRHPTDPTVLARKIKLQRKTVRSPPPGVTREPLVLDLCTQRADYRRLRPTRNRAGHPVEKGVVRASNP